VGADCPDSETTAGRIAAEDRFSKGTVVARVIRMQRVRTAIALTLCVTIVVVMVTLWIGQQFAAFATLVGGLAFVALMMLSPSRSHPPGPREHHPSSERVFPDTGP
jgi:hypothetical protein